MSPNKHLVHPKMLNLLSYAHPSVVLNLYVFLLLNTKEDNWRTAYSELSDHFNTVPLGCGASCLFAMKSLLKFKINFKLLVIFQDNHILDWSNLGVIHYPYKFYFLWNIWKIIVNLIIHYNTSGFWATFIYTSLYHHWIALHYMF